MHHYEHKVTSSYINCYLYKLQKLFSPLSMCFTSWPYPRVQQKVRCKRCTKAKQSIINSNLMKEKEERSNLYKNIVVCLNVAQNKREICSVALHFIKSRNIDL